MTRLTGTLYIYADTGSEGIVWSFTDSDPAKIGYDKLNLLENGDHLTIYDTGGGVEWDGDINLQFDTCLEPYPYSEKPYFWQRVRNCTVHGIQNGVDPEVWLQWFIDERQAVLERK